MVCTTPAIIATRVGMLPWQARGDIGYPVSLEVLEDTGRSQVASLGGPTHSRGTGVRGSSDRLVMSEVPA